MAGLEHALRAVSPLRRAVRSCSRHPRRVLAVWLTALAVLASGVGYLWWQDHHDAAVQRARTDAVAAIAQHVRPILSYSGDTAERDLAAAAPHLTGSFRAEFARMAETLVVPAARRDGINTSAEVVASSLVSATDEYVVALVFVTQRTTSEDVKEPRINPGRLRMALSLVDGRWLVSDLKPV